MSFGMNTPQASMMQMQQGGPGAQQQQQGQQFRHFQQDPGNSPWAGGNPPQIYSVC
jgi:hypothetical protein